MSTRHFTTLAYFSLLTISFQLSLMHHNYCRNPDIKDKVWCFTSADDWEYCEIPDCNANDIVPKNGTEGFISPYKMFSHSEQVVF